MCVGSSVGVRVLSVPAGLAWFELPLAPAEGARRVSYRPVQVWGDRRRGRKEA